MTTKSKDNLETYRAKRKADRTPEPFRSHALRGHRFVVQHHAARARHYDFRLELDGVLKSWAVPKGPSPNPADKRLAMHVEDHPVEYAAFEGVIPAGNYGAGAVIVWDRGRWVPLNDASEGLETGKLLFELRGYKLRGKWTLVKTRRGKNEWLLIKERDAYVSTAGTEDYPPGSVLSGRTVDELKEGTDRGAPLVARLEALGARRRAIAARDLKHMLATPGEAFDADDWLFELKYDGYRLFAVKRDGETTLISRNGNDLTATFPDIHEVVNALPYSDFVIDGEAVVHDERGLPSFARLQKRGRLTRRIDAERAALDLPATFYAFDLPAFAGYDLRPLPLVRRKELLAAALPAAGAVRFSEHVATHGTALFAEAERMGLEGIVAKRAESPYAGKRSADWVKVNAAKSDDFAVVGSVPSAGAGKAGGFAALLLGQYDAAGELQYAGRVGTGFTTAEMRSLAAELTKAAPADPPQGAPAERDATWIVPTLVVQVKFKQRGKDGALRQPVFMRVRDDKRPHDCVVPERADEGATEGQASDGPASDGAPAVADSPTPRGAKRGAKRGARDDEQRTVDLTNLKKVFWPAEGYTKGDLIDYYTRVAEWLLPYLKDRPVVLTRYPDGIEGKSFFQKDAPAYAPRWLRLETMWSEHAEREIRYFVLDDLESLVYVINMGTIPLHVWSSRVSALERPDWCILDLDPKGAPFKDVVAIARFLRELCSSVDIPTFVKTSGSTGLHVLIPLGARFTYEQSRTLAEVLARFAVSALPDIATIVRAVESRDGKVYVDYLQNGHGRLLVAPLSARPLPGAPVSMPLTWDKVTPRLKLGSYHIRNAPRLLARDGDPLSGVLHSGIDMPNALDKLARELGQ